MESKQVESSRKFILLQWIFWSFIGAFGLLLGGVVLATQLPEELVADWWGNPALTQFGLMAAFNLALAHFMPKKVFLNILKTKKDLSAKDIPELSFVPGVIGWSLSSAAALFGVCLALVTKNPTPFYILAGASMVSLFFLRPNIDKYRMIAQEGGLLRISDGR